MAKRTRATKMPWDTLGLEPVIVTRLERLDDRYARGEFVEGFFVREPHFRFEAYLDDVPGRDTLKNTRIKELYFRTVGDDFPHFAWHAVSRNMPTWAFGKRILDDFIHGLEPAIAHHTRDNHDYCRQVVESVFGRLDAAGFDRAFIVRAAEDVLAARRASENGGGAHR